MKELDLKVRVFNACHELLELKIQTANIALKDLEDTATAETKSSAGDKFETAREMMQQELARNQRLLNDALTTKALLSKIDPCQVHTKGQLGSLIKTDTHLFFLGIGLGPVDVGDLKVMVLSLQSPIGMKLNGCLTGDQIQHLHQVYTIKQIL